MCEPRVGEGVCGLGMRQTKLPLGLRHGCASQFCVAAKVKAVGRLPDGNDSELLGAL